MAARSRTSAPASPEAEEVSFEEALAELEKITQALDGEAQGLDELVAKYERGMNLLQRCQRQLDTAQLRIEQISRRADGGAELTPFTPPTASPASARPGPPLAASPPPVASDDEIRLF